MRAEDALREVSLLLDRYVELSNHYSEELRENIKKLTDSKDRLTALIDGLEAIETNTGASVALIGEEEAQGQNIVPTRDTLEAMNGYRDEILSRLESENPNQPVPRNLKRLRHLLQEDVLEFASRFPSFTLAFDKLIDLSRLTLVPDKRLLRVRDNLLMATVEFEHLVVALVQLTPSAKEQSDEERGSPLNDPRHAFESLCIPLLDTLDPAFRRHRARVEFLLDWRANALQQSAYSQDLPKLLTDAQAEADTLALVGLELGFCQWLRLSTPGPAHRKTIIKSLLCFSKLFLIERSWRNGEKFTGFAIALTQEINRQLGLDDADGTAMLQCNQYWARYKLGENLEKELNAWDVSALHPRYTFLKSVLLRQYDDAIRILETLLPARDSGESGNFSWAEAEEWPILEDLRSSDQYDKLRKRLLEGSNRSGASSV